MLVKSFCEIPARFFMLLLLLLLPLTIAGCASTPVIKMPKTVPDIVKDYKSVSVSHLEMHDTGLSVKEGDYIIILPKGVIRQLSAGPTRGGGVDVSPDLALMYRIGEKGIAKRFFGPFCVGFTAQENGNIFLGIKLGMTNQYGDPLKREYFAFIGKFIVDIIIFQRQDPILIANFLEDISRSDPENNILDSVATTFRSQKEIFLAEEKAKKEVEETKKAIVALKGKEIPELNEAPQKKGVSELSEERIQKEAKQAIQTVKEKEAIGIKDAQKEKQIAELNERLQNALQALKDLEEMKKKMAEQQQKEKDLIARLQSLEEEKSKSVRKSLIIAIASPKDGISVDSEYINLLGVAEGEEGIVKFEILVNQQPVSRKDQRALQLVAKDLRRIDFSERIRLREGKNEISVVAYNREGLTTEKTISIQFTRKKEEVWAVVIGINQYKNLPSLKYAANDAREFYRYLTEANGVPKDHIWLLLDEEATLDKLRSTLGTQLRRQAGKDDTVIIYLAGHGATERDATSPDGDGLEKYILPNNADLKDLYASAMPMSEVARIFNRISSERLVFISDTCYSGASGGRTIPVLGGRGNISGAFLDRLSQGKGRVILTASDANEVSVEKDELKHGVFTYYLLEALRGQADMDKDGVVTFDEVYRYVSMKVPQATGQDQHPVKKGEMTGQIVLGVVK